jgi:hypothetical protein
VGTVEEITSRVLKAVDGEDGGSAVAS